MISSSFWEGVQSGISGVEEGLERKAYQDRRDSEKALRLENEKAVYQSIYRPMESDIGKQLFPDNVNNLSIDNYLKQKILDPKEVDLKSNDSIQEFSNNYSKKIGAYFDHKIKIATERGNGELTNDLIKQRDRLIDGFNSENISRQVKNNHEKKDVVARELDHRENLLNFEKEFTNDSHTGFAMILNGDIESGNKFLNDLREVQKNKEKELATSKGELGDYEKSIEMSLAKGLSKALRERGSAYSDEELRLAVSGLDLTDDEKERVINGTNRIVAGLHLNDSQLNYNKEVGRKSEMILNALSKKNLDSVAKKYSDVVDPIDTDGRMIVNVNNLGNKLVVGNLFDPTNRELFLNSVKNLEGNVSDEVLELRDIALMIEDKVIKPGDLGSISDLKAPPRDIRIGFERILNNPNYMENDSFNLGLFMKKNHISEKEFKIAEQFFNRKFVSLGGNDDLKNGLMYSALENMTKDFGTSSVDTLFYGGDNLIEKYMRRSIKESVKENGGIVLSLKNGKEDSYVIMPNVKEFEFRINSINQGLPSESRKIDRKLILLGDGRETKRFLVNEYAANVIEKFKGSERVRENFKKFFFENIKSPLNEDFLDDVRIADGELIFRGKRIDEYVKNMMIADVNKKNKKKVRARR